MPATHPLVGTEPTLIAENEQPAGRSDASTQNFLIKTLETDCPIIWWDDNPDVTPDGDTQGFPWEPEATKDGAISVALEPGEKRYGVVASGSVQLHVTYEGR
jgi:hypothetical protein